jgi:hypothetical protein
VKCGRLVGQGVFTVKSRHILLLCVAMAGCDPPPTKAVKIDLARDQEHSASRSETATNDLSAHPAIGKQYRQAVASSVRFPAEFLGRWSDMFAIPRFRVGSR